MDSKIAIFDWGGICIHTYYLAEQLSNSGIFVDIYLFIPVHKSAYSNTFLSSFKNENIKVIQIDCTLFEEKSMNLNRVARRLHYPVPDLGINLLLPFKTRKLFKSVNYKYIITISQAALYWLFKTEPASLTKVIHYSLEIEKITDPNIEKYSRIYALIKEEARLLQKVKGLIIQDQLRLNAFLSEDLYKNLKIFYIPVSIPGSVIKTRGNFLYKRFNLQPQQIIILYFGAVYAERKIDKLTASFANINNPEWVLILCGGGMKYPYSGTSPNIKTFDTSLDYHDLHVLISSAAIGIALYDNSWANTRLTAFSSEKIARYLQAGVPFIAFDNESYFNLKKEFDCCVLIGDVAELEKAIGTILNNYEYYRNNCYEAYNKYYNIKNNARALTQFLLN